MKTLYGLRRVKGNVFDLAILVIILCIAFCAYLSINGTKFSLLSVPAKKADITLYLPPSLNKISVGDKIYSADSDDYIGVVKQVQNVYRKEYIDEEDYVLLSTILTDEVENIAIVVGVTLKTTDDGSYVNGLNFLSAGKEIRLRTNSNELFNANVYALKNIFV